MNATKQDAANALNLIETSIEITKADIQHMMKFLSANPDKLAFIREWAKGGN